MIALTYSIFNGINMVAAEIIDAYLQSPSSEKGYIIFVKEFVLENVGKNHSSGGHTMKEILMGETLETI